MRSTDIDKIMFFNEVMLRCPHGINTRLYTRFMALADTDRIRGTHFVGGRFENSYVDAADMPDIAPLLTQVIGHASQRLDLPVQALKAGFWFNAMGPGQRTLPHHHDEDDELLSAVYYIRVPENSGNLILHVADDRITIRPQEGKLVMFAPALVHEVTENLSQELRLSVAINIGPAR